MCAIKRLIFIQINCSLKRVDKQCEMISLHLAANFMLHYVFSKVTTYECDQVLNETWRANLYMESNNGKISYESNSA